MEASTPPGPGSIPGTATSPGQHLDLAVPDLAKTEARIAELGGSVGAGQTWEGFEWRSCEDPEGNVFDVMQAEPDAPAGDDAA